MRIKSFVVTVVAAIVLLLSVNDSFAQARPTSKNQVIGFDFVGYFLDGKELHFQYEWKASTTSAWFARALFGRYEQYTGLGVGGGHKFFVFDSRALAGFGISPLALLYFWNHEYLDSQMFVSLGGEVSYKHFIDDFFVEPVVGAGIAFGGDYISYLTKIRGYINIFFGYAW